MSWRDWVAAWHLSRLASGCSWVGDSRSPSDLGDLRRSPFLTQNRQIRIPEPAQADAKRRDMTEVRDREECVRAKSAWFWQDAGLGPDPSPADIKHALTAVKEATGDQRPHGGRQAWWLSVPLKAR